MNKADVEKLDRAGSIANKYQRQQEERQEQYEAQRYSSALEARFNSATPPQILDMKEQDGPKYVFGRDRTRPPF